MKNHYVYRITNLKENKHYYGSRSSKRKPENDLGEYYFSSSISKKYPTFKQDQKERPWEFKYKIISIFETRKEATAFEIKLHNKFDVGINDNFYNGAKQTSTGFSVFGIIRHDIRGIPLSNERKQKLSDATKNRTPITFRTKKKISDANKGRIQSEEEKLKRSISLTGKIVSEETKKKISDANKGKPGLPGDLNPSKRDDVRQKISDSKLGIPRPDMKGKAYCGCTDKEKIKHIKEISSETHKDTRLVNNGIVEKKIKKNTEMPPGFTFGKLPSSINYIPCSDEKREKISNSRKKTNEKYINMSSDQFLEWIIKIKNKGTLYRKNNLHANVTRAINARSESISYYQNMFPKD
jgi:hypothetical protein